MVHEMSCTILRNGARYWYNDGGKWHRVDGPACVDSYGHDWYQNGELHRLDGPAINNRDGTVKWFKDGLWCTPNQ